MSGAEISLRFIELINCRLVISIKFVCLYAQKFLLVSNIHTYINESMI